MYELELILLMLEIDNLANGHQLLDVSFIRAGLHVGDMLASFKRRCDLNIVLCQ